MRLLEPLLPEAAPACPTAKSTPTRRNRPPPASGAGLFPVDQRSIYGGSMSDADAAPSAGRAPPDSPRRPWRRSRARGPLCLAGRMRAPVLVALTLLRSARRTTYLSGAGLPYRARAGVHQGGRISGTQYGPSPSGRDVDPRPDQVLQRPGFWDRSAYSGNTTDTASTEISRKKSARVGLIPGIRRTRRCTVPRTSPRNSRLATSPSVPVTRETS